MAGKSGKSGGKNRVAADVHRLRGTYRASRHERAASASAAVTVEMRKSAIRGLNSRERRVVVELLDAYDGWDTASLHVLREYARSVARLEMNRDNPREHRAEVRLNLDLLKALELEK